MAQNGTSAIKARRLIDGCHVVATRVHPEVINRALMLTTCMLHGSTGSRLHCPSGIGTQYASC